MWSFVSKMKMYDTESDEYEEEKRAGHRLALFYMRLKMGVYGA